jgi:hypothetical protein
MSPLVPAPAIGALISMCLSWSSGHLLFDELGLLVTNIA